MLSPEGDFVCRGEPDPDIKADICQVKCGVAGWQEDCNSNCLSSEFVTLDFDVLDAICPYAISEDCFGTGTVEVPREHGVPIGLGPEPQPPPLISQHLLFPSVGAGPSD